MGKKEGLSRAVPMNAAQVEPLIRIRARIGRDEDGKLTVTDRSSEIVDPNPGERERRNQVGEQLRRFVSGDELAWSDELQQQCNLERAQYESPRNTDDPTA